MSVLQMYLVFASQKKLVPNTNLPELHQRYVQHIHPNMDDNKEIQFNRYTY